MSDWHIEARGGYVHVTPPATVRTHETTDDGRRVEVPAARPGFVMTVETADALVRRLDAATNAAGWQLIQRRGEEAQRDD